MIRAALAGGLALLAALTLVACDKGVHGNPNAPGSPSTGNVRELTAPSAADTPAGGPSGVARSLPHPGSSGRDAVPGVTGKGTSDIGGRSHTAQAGGGTAGGLGGKSGLGMTGSFPAAGASASAGGNSATAGSSIRPPGGGVGVR